MKLQISYENNTAATRSHHCFVSLPNAVAHSLAEMQPFASLVVLRIKPQVPFTPHFMTNAQVQSGQSNQQAPFHVAWTGNSNDRPNSLGLTSTFAAALGLREGETVSVAVQERVVDNKPRHTVRSATLRPVSYNACTNSAAREKRASDEAFENAMGDFMVLSGTADALERTILAQIRVMHVGLAFPLQLPGRDAVTVRVQSIITADSKAGDESIPYALLMPETEVHIESPPVKTNINGVDGQVQQSFAKVHGFYRVLSPSRALSSGLPRHLAATHAVLGHGHSECLESFERDRYAIVSRKSTTSKQLALPIAFTFHHAVPARHVSLPPAIWHDLRLTSLTPVLFEEVPPFELGPAEVSAEKLTVERSEFFPSFEEFISASSVYYDGMLLQNLRICLGDSPCQDASATVRKDELDPWDAEGFEDKEESEQILTNLLVPVIETKPTTAELLVAAGNKRLVKQGLRSFSDQSLKFRRTKSGDMGEKPSVIFDNLKEHNPQRQEDARSQALLSLTASGRNAIDQIIRAARSLFRPGKHGSKREENYRTVVIEGAVGSGKTYIAKAASSLVQELGSVRTVWIHCKAHYGESTKASVSRLQIAFEAAIDGGPGLVVIDDVDLLFGNRKSLTEKEEQEPDPRKKRQRHELAMEIEKQLHASHVEPVMLLMTCERFQDMDQTIRAPGVVTLVAPLPLPSFRERSLMFWRSIQRLCDNRCIDNSSNSKEAVCNLGKLTEGYTPRDIHTALKRACIEVDLKFGERGVTDASVVIEVIKEVLEIMSSSVRSGTDLHMSRGSEAMSWASVGGLDRAKTSIWEALMLPASRPEVFANAPIRLPHGILLYGPPGCGKTMLARAAVAESGMQCIFVKGPELLSKYIGESEAEVRRAFEKAANAAPCVLIFDEFDALAPRRGGESTGVADRVVNTLLTCMDGAERLSDMVYVLATTSRPELIDPAVLRPGRIDRWIAVDVPDSAEKRLDILARLCSHHFGPTPALQAVLEDLARDTSGYTGADLGAIISEARANHEMLESSEELSNTAIPDLLKDAFRESRPSLSQADRAYFHRIMSRFAPTDATVVNGSLEFEESFGKRVVLR